MGQRQTPSNGTGAELVNLFDKAGQVVSGDVELSVALDLIKRQFVEHGKAEVGVEVVHLWLMRSEGHEGDPKDPVFILQRRSDNKKLDKTVGGHVSAHMTPDGTVEREFTEETGLPGLKILSGLGRRALHEVDLTTEAVAELSYTNPWQISGRHDRSGIYYEKPTRAHTYLGFYDGPLDMTRHTDGEVLSLLAMPYSRIKELMAKDRDRFTPDAQQLIDNVAERFAQMQGRPGQVIEM